MKQIYESRSSLPSQNFRDIREYVLHLNKPVLSTCISSITKDIAKKADSSKSLMISQRPKYDNLNRNVVQTAYDDLMQARKSPESSSPSASSADELRRLGIRQQFQIPRSKHNESNKLPQDELEADNDTMEQFARQQQMRNESLPVILEEDENAVEDTHSEPSGLEDSLMSGVADIGVALINSDISPVGESASMTDYEQEIIHMQKMFKAQEILDKTQPISSAKDVVPVVTTSRTVTPASDYPAMAETPQTDERQMSKPAFNKQTTLNLTTDPLESAVHQMCAPLNTLLSIVNNHLPTLVEQQTELTKRVGSIEDIHKSKTKHGVKKCISSLQRDFKVYEHVLDFAIHLPANALIYRVILPRLVLPQPLVQVAINETRYVAELYSLNATCSAVDLHVVISDADMHLSVSDMFDDRIACHADRLKVTSLTKSGRRYLVGVQGSHGLVNGDKVIFKSCVCDCQHLQQFLLDTKGHRIFKVDEIHFEIDGLESDVDWDFSFFGFALLPKHQVVVMYNTSASEIVSLPAN